MDETERSIQVAFIGLRRRPRTLPVGLHKANCHKDVQVKQGEGAGIEEITDGLS